ncbi:hypothetical protein GGI04_002357 [Coemansia thaxteri]|uniref:Nucleosome assembly protein n=1 Tax=Coemansia thaxteri TaxID=2663907 RepID=A0A9W8BGV5_9FUNG|nr:hypothetical protein H4R26_003419 [Coemansia thaxteri]KAJ2005143.1 hypothetical protein GGI04_002357 [Coemansia thaxteri]KAJ2471401.1 hypothetical protein GGI02_002300 [Coemansia sp. RSA 2322]KAJ2487249.1 hypothetical protein EV174_000656 [Coemansia sp. RSA 2320]
MVAANGDSTIDIEGPLKELGDIYADIGVIVDQLVEEEAALHAKYELKKVDLYKKRQAVIDKIPGFWHTCAITYLQSIDIERSASTPVNYKIVFKFAENPYFTNSELAKEFDFSDKGSIKVVNSSIDWKEGKNLTASPAKTEGEEDSDNFTENEDTSFFCWFNDENGSDLADMIANDLFPLALMYFTGSAENSDDDDELPVFDELDQNDVEEEIEASDDAVSDEETEDAPVTKRSKRT